MGSGVESKTSQAPQKVQQTLWLPEEKGGKRGEEASFEGKMIYQKEGKLLWNWY